MEAVAVTWSIACAEGLAGLVRGGAGAGPHVVDAAAGQCHTTPFAKRNLS